MKNSLKPYDLVVLGATGYTGKIVVEYLVRTYGAFPTDFKWAISGRNSPKLCEIINEMCVFDEKANELPFIVTDVLDEKSVADLVSKTKVIISTAGPFQKYGSLVVKACVEGGIGYCDITGEVFWVNENVEKYHEQAQETGAKIVHCCGFDSIPSDIGVFVLAEQMKKKFGASMTEVTCLVMELKGSASGGTLASVVGQVEQVWRMNSKERKEKTNLYLLNPKDKRPTPGELGWDSSDGGFGFNKEIGTWTAPFIMAAVNAKIVRRSNALLGNLYGAPFKYQEVFSTGKGMVGLLRALLLTIGIGLFAVLLFFPITRYFVQLFFPKPGQGPTREERDNGYFQIILVGKGKAANTGQEVTLQVEFSSFQGDAGYKQTAKMLAESGLCLALEHASLPERAGVLTPATALGKTLVSRLKAGNMIIQINSVSNKPMQGKVLKQS